jgi:hypothetical protein
LPALVIVISVHSNSLWSFCKSHHFAEFSALHYPWLLDGKESKQSYQKSMLKQEEAQRSKIMKYISP